MVFLLIAFLIFIGEGNIKNYIEKNKKMGEEKDILKGQVKITRTHNKGAMLNFLEQKPKVILGISAGMLAVFFYVFTRVLGKDNTKMLKLGMAFFLGGACSNLWDRIQKGYVVDYFSFRWLKKVIFNLADIFIFLGGILIILGAGKGDS